MVRLNVWTGPNKEYLVASSRHALYGTGWVTRAKRELLAGHKVDLRPVEPGEPLADFDHRATAK